MKFGIFSDPHVTKKLQGLDSEWKTSVIESFEEMYLTFKTSGVDVVFCGGDFFDKPTLEARNIGLLNKLISIAREIKTFVLLGNHEIDSNDHNILDILSETDSNIIPITALTELSSYNVTMIPYNVDIESVDKSLIDNHIVFTHHDIYGSELAGGKVRASFGIDPNVFNESVITFNGHIHLRSTLGKVVNVGSLFSSQFGELTEGVKDHPKYYIYDTDTKELNCYNNLKSIHFITVDNENSNSQKLLDYYTKLGVKTVLRVTYKDNPTLEDCENLQQNSLKIVYKKIISSESPVVDGIKKSETLDIRSLISSYLGKDGTITPESKDRIQKKCFDILGG